jgi:hypothetical protein
VPFLRDRGAKRALHLNMASLFETIVKVGYYFRGEFAGLAMLYNLRVRSPP